MTRERCPVCDAPLATEADIAKADGADEDSDLRWATALCWSLAVPAYACSGRPPVDWRARALAAEAERIRFKAERDDLDQRLADYSLRYRDLQRERDDETADTRGAAVRDFYSWLAGRDTFNLPAPEVLTRWVAAWLRGDA